MKRRTAVLLIVLMAAVTVTAAEGTLPFSMHLGATMDIDGAPRLQSFAAAQADGKWLFVGGRIAGLHTFQPATQQQPVNNFPPAEMNERVWVIDPAMQEVWSAPLPAATGAFLKMTNPAFEQDGDTLYIAGGYGLLPGASGPGGADNMRTFDTLTAIGVSGAIQAVIDGEPLAPFVAQIHDLRMRITGGEMKKLGDRFYLVFGQTFDGLYTPDNAGAQTVFAQSYLEQIASFRIATPLAIEDYQTVTASQLTPAPSPTAPAAEARPFHRRDLTVGPVLTAGAEPALAAWGGVFPPGQITAYRKPVYIAGPAASDVRIDAYQQFMSQYNCAIVPMYSAAGKTMYTTFLGGISLYYFFPPSGELKRDGGIPFIDEVTTLSVAPDGTSRECVHRRTLPGYLGAGAYFFAAPGVARFENGVLQLDAIRKRTLIGWMYGGIRSSSPQTTQGEPTSASATAIPIYLSPLPSKCTIAAEPVE